MKPFIIRNAGGVWWIIKRQQTGTYRPPLIVNDTAAEILNLLQDGNSAAETALKLSEESGVPSDEIETDIYHLAADICGRCGVPAEELGIMEKKL